MDKASDFESEDCEFESRRGRRILSARIVHDWSHCYTRLCMYIAPTRAIGPWQVDHGTNIYVYHHNIKILTSKAIFYPPPTPFPGAPAPAVL